MPVFSSTSPDQRTTAGSVRYLESLPCWQVISRPALSGQSSSSSGHSGKAEKKVAPGRARQLKAERARSPISLRLAHWLLRSLVVRRHPDPFAVAPNVAALNVPPIRDWAQNGLRRHPDILRALELPVPR